MREKPPPEGVNHVVKDGEWVGSIAVRYGIADWDKDVWRHPKNDSLRRDREDPHVLAVDDKLFIPPWEDKEEPGQTEQLHRFKLKMPNEIFRLRILDVDGDPVTNAKYTLEIDHGPGGGSYKQQGARTDSDGVLEEVIPSTATVGRLRVPDASIDMRLDFGHLAPMDRDDEKLAIRGAQQRLSSLGYYDGPADGVMNPGLEKAISAFQQFCKDNLGTGDSRITDPGDVDGTLSKPTVAALQTFYGC